MTCHLVRSKLRQQFQNCDHFPQAPHSKNSNNREQLFGPKKHLNQSVWASLTHHISRRKENELSHLEHGSPTWLMRQAQVTSFHSTAVSKRSLNTPDKTEDWISVGGREENKKPLRNWSARTTLRELSWRSACHNFWDYLWNINLCVIENTQLIRKYKPNNDQNTFKRQWFNK